MLPLTLPEIQNAMARKGLLNEPAFQDVQYLITPIPSFDGCPLGLYFPDDEYVPEMGQTIPSGTIVMPVEAEEGTLFHELGHRYGHYHYNDLSEAFAEDYRMKYQRGPALLYQGADFERVPNFNVLFREGERGAIEMDFDRALSPDELYQLQSQLVAEANGEVAPRVRQIYRSGYPLLRIDFTQGQPWLIIIPAVIIFAVGAALFYGIYKMFAAVPWIVPTALLGLGIFMGLRWLAKREA